MTGGFSNKPKILRGAFVEYGLSRPPLVVVFQFNPEKLSRNRSLSFSYPSRGTETGREKPRLQQLHRYQKDLSKIQKAQDVTIEEETISFDIRLDASDQLDAGNPITERLGIAPQLATLELMVRPKDEELLGQALGLSSSKGYSFTRPNNPPLVLFVWGRQRVLPVNIQSLNITETAFSTDLNPIRAEVSVNLTVIEGPNAPYAYSNTAAKAMSALNLANLIDIADVVIPG